MLCGVLSGAVKHPLAPTRSSTVQCVLHESDITTICVSCADIVGGCIGVSHIVEG